MVENSKNGSVLILGAGIAGIQAALDLADSGYKVYLVESKTAIGGHMAQLDKTFPTNDCAMCTISPRLVTAGLHRNIEIITNAELQELKGEAGNFEATIRLNPNFVDLDKCTGCGLCAEECPINIPDEYNQGLNNRKAIYKLYPQAVPNKFTISKLGEAPCYDACPLHGDPSGYVALTAEGRYQEALDLVREKNPFPAICGRICQHPCETECSRCKVDEPVSIAYIKRFLADWEMGHGEEKTPAAEIIENGKKVAIIGSGPAGLTAARELRKMGYSPAIYESRAKAGGMMTLGIPSYRLPHEIIEKEIKDITDLGVTLKINSPINSEEDIEALFKDGCEAVFLSVGSHQSRSMDIEGEDLENVTDGVTFLRELSLGSITSVKERVIVVGGGNVALDCARSALRLGAKAVNIVCLEAYENMPAHRNEIDWAEEEGIVVNAAKATQSITDKNNAFAGLALMDVKKMAFVEGKLELETEPGSESTIEADQMIVAIGQAPDLYFLSDDSKINTTPRGTLDVDSKSFMTSWKGVFSGGDVVRGAASVIEAVADGRNAAMSIDAYIKGEEFTPDASNQPIVTLSDEEIRAKLKSKEIQKTPRHIMPERPVEERISNFSEVDLGLSEEAAKKEAERCLYCSICSNCRRCETVCEANALIYDDVPKNRTINPGAVILAPGFELFDSGKKGEFGYKRFPNVISALDYERILSASGPTLGHIQRISDSKTPRNIAFIQCVGSRDEDNPYCSSVCCTFAIKQSIITREHAKDTQCTIFAMDIRAFGKGFDEYFERAKNNYGVKVVYTRPSSIKQDFKTHNLQLQFTEDGQDWIEQEFDLVVLSAGLCQNDKAKEIANVCEIDLNDYSFANSPVFSPTSTNREGVYLAGTFEEPKDIPESVTHASAAAARAMELLADVRGTEVEEKVYPKERDVSQEEQRIGVFVCHCGSNIEGFISCKEVAEYAQSLKNVVYTDHLLYSCSPDGLQTIKDMVIEHNLNRVVVASCTPRTHEPLFQENIREAGLNPYLFEMANIRDQCTWVHADMGEATQEKANDLVRMAVGRARTIESLSSKTYVPKRSALVVGGGISGMSSALSVANQGHEVYLVEKSDKLGGSALKIKKTIDGSNPAELVQSLEESVLEHDKITVMMNAEVAETSGFIGDFHTQIKSKAKDVSFEHGATIIATGAEELKPSEYLFGENEHIVTQQTFEETIENSPETIKSIKEIVMIQCVGSREPDRMVCSRVCCTEAIKNAIAVKNANPEASVSILYRDIRTYGFLEKYYTEAREMGILFFRYDLENKPEVTSGNDGKLRVRTKDLNSGLEISFDPDCLVLSAGMVTPEGTQKVGTAFKIPLNLEGFFQEAHMKLRPVDFASDGIFLCGTCHSPKFIRESIIQAQGAAARAIGILSKPEMEISCIISKVDEDKCVACLTCVRTCPYDVPKINKDGIAEIEPAMCHGCGICAAECPAKAISMMHYKDRQIISKTQALYNEKGELQK